MSSMSSMPSLNVDEVQTNINLNVFRKSAVAYDDIETIVYLTTAYCTRYLISDNDITNISIY